jgi:putative NADPH-quinone reductase
MARITIIQGHPSGGAHFCHQLADAYAAGAVESGHTVRHIDVAALDFPLLRDKQEWEKGRPPPDIIRAQADLTWCSHLVIVFPLWLGDMPALLKGFMEQLARPDFILMSPGPAMTLTGRRRLSGRSSRLIVTMGMPGFIYRWFYCAHSLRNLKRNILGFSGIRPNRDTVIGQVDSLTPEQRQGWLDRVRQLGVKVR